MSDKEFKISEHGISYLSRLALPRAYATGQKLSCFHSGATEWTDYGRMRWSKPRAWRVSLRNRSIKPPATNRGVSHGEYREFYCDDCGFPFSYLQEYGEYWYPHRCSDCENVGGYSH
jgi:hypothetical protein